MPSSHWPRILALHEADVAYGARQLALGGAELLFADLHPMLQWHEVSWSCARTTRWRSALAGDGLMLIPAVFD